MKARNDCLTICHELWELSREHLDAGDIPMAAHAKLRKSQIEKQLLRRFDRAELLLRDPRAIGETCRQTRKGRLTSLLNNRSLSEH